MKSMVIIITTTTKSRTTLFACSGYKVLNCSALTSSTLQFVLIQQRWDLVFGVSVQIF
jgi:hypothetical protein